MLATSPKQTFPVVLRCDRDEPRGQQSRFFCRALSKEDWREAERLDNDPEVQKLPKDQWVARVWTTLATMLAGWSNVRDASGALVAFTPEAIPQVLTVAEACELYREAMIRSTLTDDDRKNFGWLSPSSSAGAAAADAPAGSDAKTAQA